MRAPIWRVLPLAKDEALNEPQATLGAQNGGCRSLTVYGTTRGQYNMSIQSMPIPLTVNINTVKSLYELRTMNCIRSTDAKHCQVKHPLTTVLNLQLHSFHSFIKSGSWRL
jgi:hypothetical protein